MIISTKKKIAKLQKQLSKAENYQAWCKIAKEIDSFTNAEAWKSNDESSYYDFNLIRKHINQIKEYRNNEDIDKLILKLHSSLHRNMGDVTNPLLYKKTPTGTKKLISQYLDEVEKSIIYLCEQDFSLLSSQVKQDLLHQANRNYGRSALLLSGGSTLGIFHLGVVKALWENNLLPQILCGSSMGAIVAGGICSRTDDELKELFSKPENIYRHAFRIMSPLNFFKEKAIMDPKQIQTHIKENVGNLTFLEAYQRTNRILNISVAPTRPRQKPRVLNYMTAPNVYIYSATLASTAIPGLFPPVTLEAKNKYGETVLYIPEDKWIDGTFGGDLPMTRISRLHNVNHFIVSQTNPHVIPFIATRSQKGIIPFFLDLLFSMSYNQFFQAINVIRRRVNSNFGQLILNYIYATGKQEYLGDINIYPRFDPFMYRKVLSNPTIEDVEYFILEGQRSTWPKLAMINDHTRVARTFQMCSEQLAVKE
ncbi:MAG: DUF3336 domain-containing protein [Desulfobacterales bacterium]|nr:DUF3336 domain-containing protein [Desulfobacterales bacterium]